MFAALVLAPARVLLTPVYLRARRGCRRRAGAIGLGAFALSSLVVGSVLAALTASANHDLNHPMVGSRFDPDLAHRARLYQTLEQSSFAVAGVALAGGVVLFVLGHRDSARSHAHVRATNAAHL
jgi:hypothetical protein